MNSYRQISSYSSLWLFLFTIRFTFLCSIGCGRSGGSYRGDFSSSVTRAIIDYRDYAPKLLTL